MGAELGVHRTQNLTKRSVEDDGVELLDHLAGLEGAELATLFRRRTRAVLLGDRGKLSPERGPSLDLALDLLLELQSLGFRLDEHVRRRRGGTDEHGPERLPHKISNRSDDEPDRPVRQRHRLRIRRRRHQSFNVFDSIHRHRARRDIRRLGLHRRRRNFGIRHRSSSHLHLHHHRRSRRRRRRRFHRGRLRRRGRAVHHRRRHHRARRHHPSVIGRRTLTTRGFVIVVVCTPTFSKHFFFNASQRVGVDVDVGVDPTNARTDEHDEWLW